MAGTYNQRLLERSVRSEDAKKEEEQPLTFFCLFGITQLAFIILFFRYTKWDDTSSPKAANGTEAGAADLQRYSMFQDVHVMILIGFGFLMTFLKSYGYSAITFNFLVSVFCLQWGILTCGFFAIVFGAESGDKITLHLSRLLDGDFAAGSMLISLGAVLGRTTVSQLFVMMFIHNIVYALNIQIAQTKIGGIDTGGTITIHLFGAYFGLAVSYMLTHGKRGPERVRGHPLNGSVYHSDLFSMIGTLFLWCFWPSFNAVTAVGNGVNRAVFQTIFSIAASCMGSILASAYLRPKYKFNMVDIQNATLAGGVAVGAAADQALGGGGALLIGTITGIWATFGFVKIMPWLETNLGLFDTCGVHNLHGMSAIIGVFVSAISAANATEKNYGANLSIWFPNMVSEGYGPQEQALRQLYAGLSTLVIAIASGLLAGKIMQWEAFFDQPEDLFTDEPFFAVDFGRPEPQDDNDRITKPNMV